VQAPHDERSHLGPPRMLSQSVGATSDAMSEITRLIRSFHRSLEADVHHRYRSWGHCYSFFRRRNQLRASRDFDLCALHLGFYLASWGMYRGSSFLLWKDYKLHTSAVKELLKPQYDSLLDLDMESETTTKAAIPRIVHLRDGLKAIYGDRVQSVNGHREKVKVTDTLVTKILLGVLACVPAYDTYVVARMRGCDIPYSTVNLRHLSKLASFYRQHVYEFKGVRRMLREGHIRYPVMKLVDMYFWEKGRQALA